MLFQGRCDASSRVAEANGLKVRMTNCSLAHAVFVSVDEARDDGAGFC